MQGEAEGRTTLCALWQSAQSECAAPSLWTCVSCTILPKMRRSAKSVTNQIRICVFDVRNLLIPAMIPNHYTSGLANFQFSFLHGVRDLKVMVRGVLFFIAFNRALY